VSVLEGGYNTRGEVPIHCGDFCGVSDIARPNKSRDTTGTCSWDDDGNRIEVGAI